MARRCFLTGLTLPYVCIMDRLHGPVQLVLIDLEHSEGIQHSGAYGMDERMRSVSPANHFNTNPLNPFWPHKFGWVEPLGLRHPDLLALQAIRMPEQGRLVRERMEQALRLTESAGQTFGVSLAFNDGGGTREPTLESARMGR